MKKQSKNQNKSFKNRSVKHIQTRKRFTIILFLLVFPLAAWLGASFASNAFASEKHTPVILVHGYNNRPGNCQGINLASYWRNVKNELIKRAEIPAADVVPVSYYRCDNQGVDITGYGPGISYTFTMTSGRVKPRVGHTNNSSITRVAQDLAWFIHNEYTQKDRAVNVVGHSMGGLITREALRRVQAGDPAFPSTLDVHTVITMSTPHNGWGVTCKSNTQCTEMTDGSAFLAKLQSNPAPQGLNGTAWWAMATAGRGTGHGYLSGCDAIPTDSATAVGGADLVYTKPCYRHNAYLNDKSQRLDAVGSEILEGRHSLAMMVHILK